jgi:hypothetical protein
MSRRSTNRHLHRATSQAVVKSKTLTPLRRKKQEVVSSVGLQAISQEIAERQRRKSKGSRREKNKPTTLRRESH